MGRMEELAERATIALEALAQDPIIEIEAAPPICPHCGKMNPTITIEEGGEGPLAEIFFAAKCGECNKGFFAVPVTWHMHTTLETIREEMKERAELQSNGKH
jgi:hypothetical protein